MPTGVIMHKHNHERAVALAKKQSNSGWLLMLEPATEIEPDLGLPSPARRDTRTLLGPPVKP
jgi:hypothetical protein